MTPEQQSTLNEKRKLLQQQLQFKEFFSQYIAPFSEVLESLNLLKINYQVVLARCIPKEYQHLLIEQFNLGEFKKYNLSEIEITSEDEILERLFKIFPNKHALRYLLDFESIKIDFDYPKTILNNIIHSEHLTEQQVYLCYLGFGFVLQIDFQDLSDKVSDDIFNTWHGDTVIFPKNQEWMIAYSLENEWRFGRKSNQ